jgi:hypothetical protein
MWEPTADLKDQNSLKPKTRVHLFKNSIPTLQITGSFPVAKRPGSGVDHAPHSGAEAVNGLELHIRIPSVPAYASHGVTFTLTSQKIMLLLTTAERLMLSLKENNRGLLWEKQKNPSTSWGQDAVIFNVKTGSANLCCKPHCGFLQRRRPDRV